MDNANLLDDEEQDLTPGTPVIQPDTKRSPHDENEYLFGDDDLDDNEDDLTDDTEDDEDDTNN